MQQIKKVLVPTDFSRPSISAVYRGVALANQCGAALTILHVIDINTQAGFGPGEEVMQRLWQEGSTQMAQLAGLLTGRAQAQTVIEEGLPCQTIVAKSREFDLMILGKGRPKPVGNLFSKHTVRWVIENAVCPVLVVRQDEARDRRAQTQS